MKIITQKENLLKAINIADSIISSKSINTILSNCLFNITSKTIEIISTDNEIALKTKIEASSESKVTFIANGKKFSELLKEMPNDDIIIDLDEKMVINIRSKSDKLKGSYKFIGAVSDEFPEIKTDFNENLIEIDQPVLKEMIKKVIYAASVDTIKPVFNGIYFITDEKGSLTAVATDSRRLSVVSRKMENEIIIEDGIILPLKTVHEVYRLLDSKGRCQFAYNNKQCYFKIGNTEILSRIVDGQFPNFKQVIPKEQVISSVIDTGALYNSIKRSMVFSREPANKIILTFKESSLLIEANTPELGECREEIIIESDSKTNISLGINAQFLVDALKEIDSPSITCGITGQMSPVKISYDNDKGHISIIMPIQIK